MRIASTDEDEIERLVLAYSPKFQGILDVAGQQIRDGNGMKHEDFWREVESEGSNAGDFDTHNMAEQDR